MEGGENSKEVLPENYVVQDNNVVVRDEGESSSSEEKPPQTFNQEQLNDLIRDLGLSKNKAELIASELKKRNMLSKNVEVSFYRDREKEFRKYFTQDLTNLVHCTNVKGLTDELKPNVYKPDEWWLFVDSSEQRLEAVLLHNQNIYAALPLAHSIAPNGITFCEIQIILNKIKYEEHGWPIYGNLKFLSMMKLGQQSDYNTHPCYLCTFDSTDNRDNQYKRKVWPSRSPSKPDSNQRLVEPSKILIHPLYVKLELVKQFVQALNKHGRCFTYLGHLISNICTAELKEGVFDEPQLREMIADDILENTMNDAEKAAWLSFKDVATKLSGNSRGADLRSIVETMIKNYEELGCSMNLELHFLHSHFGEFMERIGDFSEEQGEQFYQDTQEFERLFEEEWNISTMADYCWMLKRDTRRKKQSRSPPYRSFEERVR